MPLAVLPNAGGATIGWINLYGGPGEDLDDPVYIHTGGIVAGTSTATNDLRLTNVAGKPPGSKVGNLDPDLPEAFAIPPAAGSPNPITTTGLDGQIPRAAPAKRQVC